MPPKVHLQIVYGSSRETRRGEPLANWVAEQAKGRPDFTSELIDLKDWQLPYYNEPGHAQDGEDYSDRQVQKWSKLIARGDGYLIITPEYNHGYPAVLKSALDALYAEWVRKPIGFISYGGGAGGSRAVEQLRLVAVELQMVPIRNSLHFPRFRRLLEEGLSDGLAAGEKQLSDTFEELIWWGETLKSARLEKS